VLLLELSTATTVEPALEAVGADDEEDEEEEEPVDCVATDCRILSASSGSISLS